MPARQRLAVFSIAASIALAMGCNDEPARQAKAEPPVPVPAVQPAPSAPSGVPTPQEQATIEKVMDARDEMARVAETHAGNCDAAAKGIEEVVERSRALLAASAQLDADPAKRKWIGEKYGARMLASSSKVMALIETCDQHEGLARIFEWLD